MKINSSFTVRQPLMCESTAALSLRAKLECLEFFVAQDVALWFRSLLKLFTRLTELLSGHIRILEMEKILHFVTLVAKSISEGVVEVSLPKLKA